MRNLLFAFALLAAPVAAGARHSGQHDMAAMDMSRGSMPKESGQAAFGAIAEAVAILEADPRTDWSKVDVDMLRAHLIDMDNVTLRARVTSSPVAGGMRFEIAGDGPVRDSIRRMAKGHAATTDGIDGRHTSVIETADGASMTVTSDDPAKVRKIGALGFFGLLSGGVHHPSHHLMMAKGEMRH
jgi:hypothetical protein